MGTTKGGTSSLHLWLDQHPQISLSRPKELHFFCSCPNPRLRAAETLEDYLALFPPSTVAGESSPCYLYYTPIPGRIKDISPDARILISLRDPVDRFWSHYLMNEIYRPTRLPPEQVLESNIARGHSNALEDLFGMGLYTDQVERFFDAFGRDRVFVTLLDDLASRPGEVVTDLFAFLGLPAAPVNTATREKEYVEPRGTIGRLAMRNPTARRIGNAILAPSARRYLRTRVLGDPTLKPRLDPSLESPRGSVQTRR